jgi:16S rRNA G966 N2-methylase RsmD
MADVVFPDPPFGFAKVITNMRHLCLSKSLKSTL